VSKRWTLEFCMGRPSNYELPRSHHTPWPPAKARAWSEPPSVETRYIPASPYSKRIEENLPYRRTRSRCPSPRGGAGELQLSVPSTRLPRLLSPDTDKIGHHCPSLEKTYVRNRATSQIRNELSGLCIVAHKLRTELHADCENPLAVNTRLGREKT